MTKKVEQKVNRQLTNRVKRWLAALESGKYKQARGVLRNDKTNGFCCLGVACDVYKKMTKQGSWDKHSHKDNETVFELGSERAVISPPNIVREFFGFSPHVDVVSHLITKNDIMRMKFSTIARYIRKNKDMLFQDKLGKI